MADTKISQLTNGNPAQSGDEIPVNRGGSNVKVTAGSVAALGGGSSVTLKVSGTNLSRQDLLNLKPGANVTLTDDGAGGVIIAASVTGGGGSVNWGAIGGTLSSQADLQAALAAKTTDSTLATVAKTGSYNDLSNKPSIPAAQVQTDWNASSGMGKILNKPTLATVATSGDYNDLINKPTGTGGNTLVPDSSYTGSINGSNQTFTLPEAFTKVMPYRNGSRLKQGVDFTVSGNSITLTSDNGKVLVDDVLVIDYVK